MKVLKLNLLILLIHVCCGHKDVLPTFLLDHSNVLKDIDIPPNPFSTMSSAKFADIIRETIKRTEGIIIFVEELLSFEEITAKDKLGTPFTHLHRGLIERKVKFFPAVFEPYKVLAQIFHSLHYNTFHLDSAYNLSLKSASYIYVFFNNYENETRTMALRRHDTIIRDVYMNMQELQRGPIVAFYTGKINPAVIEKPRFISIEPMPSVNNLDVTVVSEGAMFRFSGVTVATPTRRATFNQMPVVAEETWSRNKLSTKVAYTDFELLFNFDLTRQDEWVLENIALLEAGEEVGRTNVFAKAPWNWSYACGEPLQIVNTRDGSSIAIPRYRIQPLGPSIILRNGSSSNVTFGPTVNCCPYFSVPILSCLAISLLCLMFLAQGITVLFNCASNSKFDDPHNPPLVYETQ
ncbi:uncharacterized protein LOC114239735 [Bombyx mandarina]|uniref:Uncharacterized protein LOC114239735 n=1 Tax=Bombyx mandarina TaxID=7092 RepID=A0A6J2J8Y6_BOMMA|nr:uncharacterized protein LOC114239735 [Bombyx mandarina]